ncbi:MAG: hypothetical protein ACK5IC_00680 [Moheibacter sp.]
MKRLAVIGFCIIFFFSCTGKTAIGYNDTIINPQLKIVENMDSLFNNPNITYESVKQHREAMVKNAENGLEQTIKLENFKENNSFKNASIDYFTFVKSYFSSNNIDSIIYSLTSEERIKSLDNQVYEENQKQFSRYLELEEKLLTEQQNFAKEFGIRLNQ